MSRKKDEMLPISKVAAKTGVSVNTIRRWCLDGAISPAERRMTPKTVAWYTTIAAVKAKVGKPSKVGRPLKIGT